MEILDMSGKMVFIVGSPRSGSTLMERMISSHSKIQGGPEPHLLTPLAHLGYYETVDKAPYDHLRAVQAQRDFVATLPRGEEDYLDALRAYCNVLYGRALNAAQGKTMLLDKTPAYALVLPFISKVFPNAKYIVLTRHPGAIFSSFADSFFEGDWEAAYQFNPIVERYVPAIARFIREKAVPMVHVRYEDIVTEPDAHLQRICEMMELEFEPGMVNYGQQKREQKGLGDPIGVNQHSRPVTSSVDKWVNKVAGNPARIKMLQRMIGGCNPEDLETWGYPADMIYEQLTEAENSQPPAPGKKKKKNKYDAFKIERWLLHKVRRNIHHNALGKLVKKIRFACDVLMR